MGLIRFLFFLLIVWVLWFMARNWLRNQEQGEAARKNKAKLPPGMIVRCKFCEVHLPEQDALRDGKGEEVHWFCTQAHKQAWLDSNGHKRDPS